MRARLLLTFLALAACDKRGEAEPPKETAPPATKKERGPVQRRSTPGELAVHNLEESLKQAEAGLKKNPKSLHARETLLSLLLQRASFLGKVSDLKRAVELAEETMKLEPHSARAFRMRARAYAAVHRFADALADLDQAEKLGASANDTRSARGTSLLALGKYEAAYALLHEQRQKFPDSTSMTLEAAALGRMNRHDDADKLFVKAVEKYRGTSPFGIAWIYFEHGSMWDRAGESLRARSLYQKAVEKLPMYAHAVGHLAALVAPAEAQALLERVLQHADDPEYRAMLSSIAEKRQPGSGKVLLDQAKRDYDRLMRELPLAFADHAGWFYLDVAGDADRAVEIAEQNLAAREVPEAFELAIAAQLAAGDKDEACVTADRALALPHTTLGAKLRAAEAYRACGKKDRASELAKEERKLRAKH